MLSAVLFTQKALDGIAGGAVTLAFRRWARSAVRAGSRLRTPIGVIEIDRVDAVAAEDITDRDARRAGHASAAELRAALAGRTGTVYRIGLHLDGPDPRVALRGKDDLDADELADVRARLSRMDAAGPGPWTAEVLALIRDRPAVRAAELAESFGWETATFKRRVRRLKELGLTESLEIGYRLSPHGIAVLRRLG
jgi:hypothetical protein